METRKLQRTGGSSLIVTLPKKWVEKNNLQDKDLVKVYGSDSQSLLLRPLNTKKSIYSSQLDIHNLSTNILTRELIAHYISGVDDIVITCDRITPDKRNAVRSLSNFFIGFEIIDESAQKIVIRNLFDPAKFPISKNIEKMFFTTISMFDDALKALLNDDKVLAKDVIQRDFEIDKLHLFTMRQRHSLTMNKISEEDLGMNIDEIYYYEYIATQLERIADHAVKIARIIASITKKFDKIVDVNRFNIITDKIKNSLEEANNMVKNIDKNTAHKILDEHSGNEHIILEKSGKHTEEAFIANLVDDSFDRVRGYTLNIAELTIDLWVARKNKFNKT